MNMKFQFGMNTKLCMISNNSQEIDRTIIGSNSNFILCSPFDTNLKNSCKIEVTSNCTKQHHSSITQQLKILRKLRLCELYDRCKRFRTFPEH